LSRVAATSGALQVPAVDAHNVALATWGTGTATIDFVADVPVGTQTVLQVCKSQGGTASASVTRTTFGTARVAGLVDSRSDNVSVAGCDNPATAAVSRYDLLGTTPWPTLLDQRHLVLSFYYPWYSADTFDSGSWIDKPTGPYNTDDPSQVQQMVQEAAGNGINGFIVSYNGFTGLLPRLDHVLAGAHNVPGFEVSALAELDNLAGPDGQVSAAALEAWFAAIVPRMADPSWLRVNGRPVVFFFSQWRVTPSTWATVRSALAAEGQDPFVMGQSITAGFPVDGLYQYTPNVVPDSTQLPAWDQTWQSEARFQTALLPAPSQVLWAAPVSPGQNDSLLGPPQLVVPRLGGTRFDQTWQAALATRPEWTLVSTWNEFYENTQVAPSTRDGSGALSQTATWAQVFAGMN